mgnify:CR=1 FL=1
MDSFLLFFETMPSWQKLVWIFIVLLFSWILEAGAPLFKMKYSKWKHARSNFAFLAMTVLINLFFGIATIGVFNFVESNQLGLLNVIELSFIAEILIAIVIFDLVAQYWIHYLLHKFKWMWRLHMVHHSDKHIDATSGLRLHPGDFLSREIFALGVVIILGVPFAIYVFYRICTIFFTFITHANIALPLWLDKTLSLVFITPNMHKFHHHFERPWTDTNFGSIFSFWDRIFGTMVYDDPSKIQYGLDVLDHMNDEDVLYQLKVPFDNSIKNDY